MEKRKRRRFTAEYKAEAVKRLDESGKGLQQVADELGVHANQLRGWRNEHLAIGSAEALAGLWRKLGDDGLRRVAYRGG
jgi:transposase